MRFPFRIALGFLFLVTVLSHPSANSRKKGRNEVSTSSGLQFYPSCIACKSAVWFTTLTLKVDFSETVILKLAKIICNLFAKQSYVVCDGISGQFREEFFYVFRQLGHSSPSQICGILLPDCADASDPSQAGWEVALPPKPKRKRVGKKVISASRPIRVLQLSDLHIDFEYAPGTESKCNQPVCCREGLSKNAETTSPAGYWGTVASCDIPIRTLEHMLQYINQSIEIDYVMMTGDYINHVDWQYSKEGHLQVLREIGGLVRKYFKTTPVFWAVGNHEGVPVNSFAPHFVEERFWPTWLYSELANLSQPWISNEANETMNYRGSYSIKIIDGLRLISLNTGFCETTNFFMYLNQSDPDGTMSWLVAELYKAELAAEKVHIMAHIPPGDGECLEGWARNYYRVIQRFSSTITAQFFGHVHTDYFTVYYKDMHNISSKPIGVSYSGPSATTFSDLNPGFRVYEVSVDGKYEILEIENYYADLDKANATSPPDWKLLYKAKRDFNMTDLSPSSWERLIQKFEYDDDAFDDFVHYSYRTEAKSCGLPCRQGILCSMRMGHHNSTLYCPPPRSQRSKMLKTNRLEF